MRKEKNERSQPEPTPVATNADTIGDLQLDELDGYADLGMKHEALGVARVVFKREHLTVAAFVRALNVVLVHAGRCKPWTRRIETAYHRLPASGKKAVRPDMLGFYCSIRDYDKAQTFVSRRPESVHDWMFSLDTLVYFDRMKAAKALAKIGWLQLEKPEGDFERSLLVDTLAGFHARRGEWDVAQALWRKAPLGEPLVEPALTGIVEIHAARALVEATEACRVVEALKKGHDAGAEIELPGNRAGILQDTENHLKKLIKSLTKVLPERRQKELGL